MLALSELCYALKIQVLLETLTLVEHSNALW